VNFFYEEEKKKKNPVSMNKYAVAGICILCMCVCVCCCSSVVFVDIMLVTKAASNDFLTDTYIG
jgi:hypothetical protein